MLDSVEQRDATDWQLFFWHVENTGSAQSSAIYDIKSYGFTSEYWDGYSNQVTAVVDDPSQPNQYKQDQFLNVGRIY